MVMKLNNTILIKQTLSLTTVPGQCINSICTSFSMQKFQQVAGAHRLLKRRVSATLELYKMLQVDSFSKEHKLYLYDAHKPNSSVCCLYIQP